MLQAGTVVDEQFEIVCSLGSGAQATVYRALDLHLQREIALKLMHIGAEQDLNSQQRFQREARLISLLQHPNILRCYKFGQWEGSFYTCVDFFDGTSLADLLREGAMPWRRAVRICIEVAHGMQHAHAHGVVHRDLTPRNIMLAKEAADFDQVKVVDFGLGKWLGTDASYQKLTQTGDVVGSIYCMSPEQCSGKEADGRSDVYALGCILYNCLTGEPSFLALEPLVLMHKHLTEQAKAPSALAGFGCPARVDDVVAKALAKSADDRYQTMAEFASDLQALLDGKVLSAATAALVPANRSRHNNTGMIYALLAGIFLLSAVAFKTQIICSVLSLMTPANACSIAAYLVQDAVPLSKADRTEIAIHGAGIAEGSALCNPDAITLYARSDRWRTSCDGSGKDPSHGSLMALKTLVALSGSPSAPTATEYHRLAASTLNDIPAHCWNHEVGRLCFAIVPSLDESLRERYVRKGLEIIDAAQNQSGLALVAKLIEYASYLDRADLVKLKVPIAERCLEALVSVSPTQPGRAVAYCQTALMLAVDDPRRLNVITDCLRQSEQNGQYRAVDTQAAKQLIAQIYVDALWHKAHSLAVQHHPEEAMREFRRSLEYIKTNRTMTPDQKTDKFANATLGATLVILDDKARAKEITAMLDTLKDLPPSFHEYSFWRDILRGHLMRKDGRFAECQTYLESLMLRYPAAFDVARIRRNMGHVKIAQGQLDGGIADFKESLTIFAKVKDSGTIGSFANELDDTRRNLALVEARKQSLVRKLIVK